MLLRQVIANHGASIPAFRVGKAFDWLPSLPGRELVDALDRCTVVLPRPGDGFYAPPPGSNEDGSAGFPWGELTAQGAEQMRRVGRDLIFREPLTGRLWSPSEALIRAANRPSCVASAQAMIMGGLEAHTVAAEGGGRGNSGGPGEILLQGGEDLLPACSPKMPDYPAVPVSTGASITSEEGELLKRCQGAVLGALQGKEGTAASTAASEAPDLNVERTLEAWMCLEAASLWGGSSSGGAAALASSSEQRDLVALKRLNFQQWAAPLRQLTRAEATLDAASVASAARVLGPLLRELIRSCDAALEEGSGAEASLAVYAAQAPTLVALQCLLLGRETEGAGREAAAWPDFGAILEVVLLETEGGSPVLRFARGGERLRSSVPYEQFRERLSVVLAQP